MLGKDRIFQLKGEYELKSLEQIYFYICDVKYREFSHEKYLAYFEENNITKKIDDNETVISIKKNKFWKNNHIYLIDNH